MIEKLKSMLNNAEATSAVDAVKDLQELLLKTLVQTDLFLQHNEPSPQDVINVLTLVNNRLNDDNFYDMFSAVQLEQLLSIAHNIIALAGDNNDETSQDNDTMYEQQVSES